MLAFSLMLPARLATETDVWHSRRIKALTDFNSSHMSLGRELSN